MKTKRYNKKNCQGLVRNKFTDKYGRTIIVTGIHAFEWSVTIETSVNVTFTETFRKGSDARKRVSELKKKR